MSDTPYTEHFGPKSPYWGVAPKNQNTRFADALREAIDAARK